MKRGLLLITAAFIVSFIIMIVLSFVSVKRLGTLINATDNVERSYNVLAQVDKLEVIIKDIDRLERGYMITHDSEYIRLLAEPLAKLSPATDTLKKMTIDDERQHDNVIWIRSYVISRLDNLKYNLRFADTASAKAISVYFYEGRNSYQQCMDYIQKMRRIEYDLLSKRNESRLFYQQLTSSGIRYLFFGFGALTVLLFGLMINEFRKRFRYQDELQLKLIELRRSHSELEQIAFAASHDLQEPLRKMQVFVDRLGRQNKDMPEASKATLERITYFATRMQDLIEDLADLTNLVTDQGQQEPADLNELMQNALTELSGKTSEKDAHVQCNKLPSLPHAFPGQIQMVFKALIDNALKFSRDEVRPVIVIKADKVNGEELADIDKSLVDQTFHRILISDNGIGFDNKFMHKMFKLFQRLHNQQSIYEGKGIGLAISQRVMANHKGHILAQGHPNAGATFKLYFPAEGK